MNCQIRLWERKDAESLSQLISNPHVLDNLRDGIPYPYTIQDAYDYIDMMILSDKNKMFSFAIVVNDEVVGSISASRLDNVHQYTAEMGYFLGEEHWGKGIMSDAVKQVCRYVFEHSNVIRIFAEPYAFNTASCRVLEKAGFEYEGTLRKNAVKNGRVLDMKMYAIIKE